MTNNESKFIDIDEKIKKEEDINFFESSKTKDNDLSNKLIGDYAFNLANSINNNLNKDIDWNKVIFYTKQLELMAEYKKNNLSEKIIEVANQSIDVVPDYTIENRKQFK